MVDWKVAPCLNQLLGQINAMAPNRNKASDGAIGDAAHASRSSDHNPWYVLNGQNWVTARDFTHDPAHGADMHKISGQLVAVRDPRIKYIIWNYRIWFPGSGWQKYTGSNNPHTKHMHVSVQPKASILSTAAWNLGNAAPISPEKEVEIMTGVHPETLPYSGNHPDAIEGWVNAAYPMEVGSNSSLIAAQWVVLNSAWGDTDYELILVGPNQTLIAPAGGNGFPTVGTLNDRERAVWALPSGCEGVALRYRNNGAWVRAGIAFPQRTK